MSSRARANTLRGLKLQRERTEWTVCFVAQRAEELSTKRYTNLESHRYQLHMRCLIWRFRCSPLNSSDSESDISRWGFIGSWIKRDHHTHHTCVVCDHKQPVICFIDDLFYRWSVLSIAIQCGPHYKTKKVLNRGQSTTWWLRRDDGGLMMMVWWLDGIVMMAVRGWWVFDFWYPLFRNLRFLRLAHDEQRSMW